MKRTVLLTLAVSALLAGAGCANEYLIATNDGRLIESDSKPEIDEDTGLITYEDHDGHVNQIPRSDVSEIKER